MLILPIGNDALVVRRLPFITMGLILTCLAAYFPTTVAMENSAAAEAAAFAEIQSYYTARDYLTLPPRLLADLPGMQEVQRVRTEWLTWYRNAPEEVQSFVDRGKVENPTAPASGLAAALDGQLEALAGGAGSTAPSQLAALASTLTTDENAKRRFLARVSSLGLEEIDNQQTELNGLYTAYLKTHERSFLNRFAFVPRAPHALSVVTHMFLHDGLFPLLFNMVFLWFAAARLEDVWGRLLFPLLYLLFGALAAVTHGLVHSGESTPLIGASGAVAGLMGAFLMRFARTQLTFFYAYWVISPLPKTGKFRAPAYLILPLWFLGELFYALFLDTGGGAYWSHVGGFVAGAGLGLVFRLTHFEERFLGFEPEQPFDEYAMPLPVVPPRGSLVPPSRREGSGVVRTSIAAPLPREGAIASRSSIQPLARRDPTGPLRSLLPAMSSSPAPGPMPMVPIEPTGAGHVRPSLQTGARPSLVTPARNGRLPQDITKRISVPPQRDGGSGLLHLARLELSELTQIVQAGDGIVGRVRGAEPKAVRTGEVAYLAAGVVQDLDPYQVRELFPSGDLPTAPALLLVLVRHRSARPEHRDVIQGHVIDGGKLRYNELLPSVFPSKQKNFTAFVKYLLGIFPSALFIPGTGEVAEHNLPRYRDLASLLKQVRKHAG